MKQLLLFTCIFWFSIAAFSQTIDDLSFGTDSTFDVVTWNIEWFPKNGQVTIDYVRDITAAIDADLMAIQEVDDINAFEQLVDNLDGYEGYLESSYFAGLAYIYKKDVIQVNDIYEIYTTSPYWSPFPRSPMVFDLNFMNERVIVINNHFKCCGNGIMNLNDPDDQETRRYYASNLLKEYIETHFPNENVIVLGDLNDILSDNPSNNVFQMFLDDADNYLFADYEIAMGDEYEWSYPTWPSHLDHLLITNELFDDFADESAEVTTIKIDEYMQGGWWEYEDDISDHRPVGLKLMINSASGLSNDLSTALSFRNYPNPFNNVTTFYFEFPGEAKKLEIKDMQGHQVCLQMIPKDAKSFSWNAEGLPNGIYVASLKSENQVLASIKCIVIK